MLDIFRYDPLSPRNPKHQFLEASRTKLGRSDLPVKAASYSVMLVHVHCREEGTRNAVTKKAYRCAMCWNVTDIVSFAITCERSTNLILFFFSETDFLAKIRDSICI